MSSHLVRAPFLIEEGNLKYVYTKKDTTFHQQSFAFIIQLHFKKKNNLIYLNSFILFTKRPILYCKNLQYSANVKKT